MKTKQLESKDKQETFRAALSFRTVFFFSTMLEVDIFIRKLLQLNLNILCWAQHEKSGILI